MAAQKKVLMNTMFIEGADSNNNKQQEVWKVSYHGLMEIKQ